MKLRVRGMGLGWKANSVCCFQSEVVFERRTEDGLRFRNSQTRSRGVKNFQAPTIGNGGSRALTLRFVNLLWFS